MFPGGRDALDASVERMKKDSIQTKVKAARTLGADAMQQVRGGTTVTGWDPIKKKEILGVG
jgi:hypothetical protein